VQLDWEKIYREFTACATDEDCGALCRSGSRGIAACCDARRLPLIVFTEELAWARSRTTCWHRRRPRNPAEKHTFSRWAEHIVPSCCVHPRRCDRPYRSATCRFFPLEPYLDAQGGFVGLTYIYGAARICPLVGRQMDLRQEFVDQSVAVWSQIFAAHPEERACYRKASRQLRYRFARQGRTIRLFHPTA
jgi:hypothetical protein